MIHARGSGADLPDQAGPKKTEVRAVDGVDLDVAEGEVVGFLGPNGAGKTTTLRMLTTLLRPTAGTATVAGYDVVKRVRAGPPQHRLRLAGGSAPFSCARAGDEVVDHGMLYGHERGAGAPQRGQELFEQLDLDGLWERQPKTHVRRPAAPARHRHGPDPRARPWSSSTSRPPGSTRRPGPTCGSTSPTCATERGATVFLTTHYLDEADALSDRIIIIDHGKIVASDTADNLKAAGRPATWSTSRSPTPATSPTAAERLGAPIADGDGARSTASHVRGRVPARRRAPCPACCATSTAPASTLELDRGAPPDPRRRLPHPDRPLAARRRAEPPPSRPEGEPSMTLPPRELHRLPPPDADEPAQPRLGASSACCSRCSTCSCSGRCSSRWPTSSAPTTPTRSSCPGCSCSWACSARSSPASA